MKIEKFWFRVCKGKIGNKYYVISESFWKWIENELVHASTYGSKSELIKKISEATNNEIDRRAISNWIYRFGKHDMTKPIVVQDSEIPTLNHANGCIHGCELFCPICKINKKIKNCPVPFIWKTDKKGKIYAYDKSWDEFVHLLKNCEKYGLLPSSIQRKFDIDNRLFRKWRNENLKPHLYSNNEFDFLPENTYWLGTHFSDGHLRNNGSKLSFTWQCGSPNPFQGYWFPQFIQSFIGIFKHKKNRSLTYIEGSKIKNTWAFRTNISSFSPVFARFLEQEKIITARKNTNTSSYSKYLPRNLVKRMINKEALFQGIMDGDGSYNISNNHGIYITLSLDPSVRYDFIKSFPLVPTASLDINEKLIAFKQNSTEQLREIRFAPSSLKSISNKYSVEDIANQIEFMLRSAENSIRPDKVHKLIQITKRISSKEYGENRHHLEIQKEIRHETRKRNMNNMIKKLEKRFPMSNGFYKPFIPKWSENFASKNVWKQEFWDFFLSGEYLIKNNYPKPEIMDFSDGVPIDFNMTQIARN